MFDNRRRRQAAKRVRPGNGRALQPFRWWQPLSRALFRLALRDDAGRPLVYAIDVRYGGRLLSDDGNGRAHLFLNDRHHAVSKLPAVFPVHGGWIEVEPTPAGLRRCHYVTDAGAQHRLTPDPASAEGRRARLAREHPVLSHWIGAAGIAVLVIPLLLLIPQIAEALFRLPPVRAQFGAFVSPIELPLWLNILLGLVAAVASTERALRLRYNWLLDSAG